MEGFLYAHLVTFKTICGQLRHECESVGQAFFVMRERCPCNFFFDRALIASDVLPFFSRHYLFAQFFGSPQGYKPIKQLKEDGCMRESITRVAATVMTAALLCFALGGCATATKSITEEDVIGTYNVTSIGDDANSKGLYTLYEFAEDGTFKMEGHAKDSSVERQGSWTLEDGKVLVNVPANESENAKEIKDAEVEIADGELSSDGIGDDPVTAKKLTDDELKAINEDIASYAPKAFSVGEQVDSDYYSFTLQSFSWEDEIYPSDTSGYYRYQADEDGKTYLLAKVEYTNLDNEYAVPGYATKAEFQIEGNKYGGTIAVDGGRNFMQSYSVEAQATATLYIFASIPDSVKDSSDVSLIWSIPKSDQYFQTYWQSSFDSTTYKAVL